MGTSKSIGSAEIQAAITRLADAIATRHRGTDRILLLGIANGGVSLAQRLSQQLAKLPTPLSTRAGTLDISFHRDDIGQHPIPKEFAPTHIPGDVQDATIILVDDVLFTGRTLKAALDEVFDHGRPTRVELAVLVDRGGRRLPVAADYVGFTFEAPENARVEVRLDSAQPNRDSIRIEPAVAGARSVAH